MVARRAGVAIVDLQQPNIQGWSVCEIVAGRRIRPIHDDQDLATQTVSLGMADRTPDAPQGSVRKLLFVVGGHHDRNIYILSFRGVSI